MSRSSRVLESSSSRRAHAHTCLGCGAHRARYSYRGRVRADRDHTLCFRCFRAASNRLRARSMSVPSGFSRTHPV
jgi:hypothetical protein